MTLANKLTNYKQIYLASKIKAFNKYITLYDGIVAVETKMVIKNKVIKQVMDIWSSKDHQRVKNSNSICFVIRCIIFYYQICRY